MKRLWGLAAFAFVAAACGGKIGGSDDGGTNGDGSTNVKCCPPSPQPSCCMSYGGVAQGNACAQVCDGMPSPGDPGWHLGTDSNGCKVWIAPTNATSFCGEPQPPPDGGPTGCVPNLGPWSPQIDPPAYSHANVCTSQQINDVYAYCFASNATPQQCQSTMQKYATCAACLITPDTASKWGALVGLANGVFDLDVPGCIALETGDAACAQHESDVSQCELASCASCPAPTDQQSFTDWQTCLNDADQTTCAKYAAATCLGEDAGAGACFPGDFKDGYFTYATLFCGQ
jgi:hypothetical protein